MWKFQIHSKEHLKKYFYLDRGRDWWLNEELFKLYNSDENDINPYKHGYYGAKPGIIIDEKTFIDDWPLAYFVIKEILTPETHPELFLWFIMLSLILITPLKVL